MDHASCYSTIYKRIHTQEKPAPSVPGAPHGTTRETCDVTVRAPLPLPPTTPSTGNSTSRREVLLALI